jgi:hypothetical protein
MRLNRWQIIGTVLSLAWAIGAAIYQRNLDVERVERSADLDYRICTEKKASERNFDFSDCAQERENYRAKSLERSWETVAVFALVPIPFGWLAAFILINVGRAQVIGFRAVVPWSTLTTRKKAFVVFCALSSGWAALYFALVLCVRYEETQVPVRLFNRAMVTELGDDLVSVKGTWTRGGVREDSELLAFPLQTSSITCYRNEHRCLEARAIVAYKNSLVDRSINTVTKQPG